MGDIGGRGSRMVSGAPPKGHWRASPKNLGTSYAGGQELLAGIQVVQVSNAHRWDFPSDIERLNALVESGLTGAGNTYIYIYHRRAWAGTGLGHAGPPGPHGPARAQLGPGPSPGRRWYIFSCPPGSCTSDRQRTRMDVWLRLSFSAARIWALRLRTTWSH